MNSIREKFVSRAAVLLCGAQLLLTAGCEGNRYELEMTVEGETLHRQLVCWRESGSGDNLHLKPMPEGELQRIAAAYGMEAPENGERKFQFTGAFPGRTPDDVGGAGSVSMQDADLGRTWMYMERFRGEDDLSTTLAAREQASDELIDAIAAWLSAEFSNHDDFTTVHEFVVGPLRDDLHNLSAYSSLGSAIEDMGLLDSTAIRVELLARLGQYALERDYLSPAELSRLVRVADEQDGDALRGALRAMLASKLGPHGSADVLDMLDDPDRLTESFNARLSDYPPYVESLEEWRSEHPDGDPADAPAPADFVGEAAVTAFGLSFPAADDLRVTLRCPQRPYRTNGYWSDNDGSVTWDRSLPAHAVSSEWSGRVLPSLLFAFWSEPDEEFQTKHLGRVVLRDEQLGDYVAWRHSLPAVEAAEWDAFIGGLEPTLGLLYRIETFRFTGEQHNDGSEGATSALSERGRQLILDGFQRE